MTGVEGKRSLLKIGRVPYSNLFPIFYILARQCDCSGYEFIEGFPSTLNRLLRSGQIDISPSSSIEYLRYKNKYTFIEGHSISSKGPVGSILLLSRRPIEELEGKTVLTSSQSETSVVLLDVILKKFYKIECPLKPTDEKVDLLLNKAEAFLSIGDDALKAKQIVTSYKLQVESKDKDPSPIYIYDLGDLWYRNTGLPFVFALWIVRKGCFTEKAELLKRFIHDLNKAKGLAMENLDKIAQALRPLLLSRYSLIITEEELIPYWKGISYDFREEHERGLELFRQYSEELGLL
ncbi:MAG: menaquinone biosynthesis protein [Thermodesulfovibrionales bacterium]|nr:menaquinone biosynthesis protein [Thermodesulfovibrionales bacterium]